ncbi:MAG TPA: bifunctional [glutamine synthetase] adenylyltransferase/[glutamine synthetase]-adenylyl-L-tyrosine phosphorylase [Nocardioidaceae bacterium]|nr:bifunctional [glutamine synthetase] adenylyltransferase/[glutamine synthetase]-adenylyl-L-tyrosine phosphorylase [Nocardioidaceae bacterium]
MKDTRRASLTGRLARLGFRDPDRSEPALARLGDAGGRLLPLIAAAADPDQAISYLADLADAVDVPNELLDTLVEDEDTAMRMLSVLGASVALGDHLLRHPEQWRDLRDPSLATTRSAAFAVRADLLRAVGADPAASQPVAELPDEQAVDALRVEYRRLLVRLAARDLVHGVGVDDVAAELSDLAAGTLEAALAIARARVGEKALCTRLAVIAMGKCGGHELNYVSDVDVIFVAEPARRGDGSATDGVDEHEAIRVATLLASNLIKICSDHTAEGTIWPVDAALRPEGRSGPLVRTLDSHEGYYRKWASTWEFQALLKARPVAGDLALGRAYQDRIGPLVWSAAERDGFVTGVQAMRARVLEHIPAAHAGRQIKLGAGGLRDVEFAVQLLQLVHGRADESIRDPATLSALAQLTRGGYVGREDGAALDAAYRFLRTLEHRMQLAQLRRVHVLPTDEDSLRRLGRAMGFMAEPVRELDRHWRTHSREVRRLHEKLFFRPLLAAVAKLPGGEARLSLEAAEDRLSALGYEDPKAALRHLEALTSGVTRSANIQRTLLPAMLGWFADAPNPDAGLLGFRKVSESLGSTHWYLQTLRDEGQVAQRLATVLASSRYATDLLQRAPEGVKMLASDEGLEPLGLDALTKEMTAAGLRQDDPVQAITAVRAVRRRELFRVSVADLLDGLDVEHVGYALSDIATATVRAALAVAVAAIEAERRGPLPTRMAVVAMGRFGGCELSFGSDADVMFVHDPLPDADAEDASRCAKDVANELRRLLAVPGTDPALDIDADLRPEGKQGPLVRSLDSYAGYYAKWSAMWESQALLRASARIGDADLCAAFTGLIDPIRYREGGITADDVREIRRIKARVDDERLPRGADPATHLKLGRGGLADVEWTIQLLQMQYAGSVPALRTAKTLDALEAAVDASLLSESDAHALSAAWRIASGLRNAIVQVRGKPSDSLPRDIRERAAVAHIRGYPPGESDALANDYLKVTRRARQVVERLFWG